MRTSTKIVSALAAAGVVAAAGAAFTATGIETSGNADVPQFIGGTVSQAVTGATLNDIEYGFVGGGSGPKTAISSITLTFTDSNADGMTVAAVPSGGAGSAFTCTAVSGTGSTCTAVDPAGYTGLTLMTITVGSSQHGA